MSGACGWSCSRALAEPQWALEGAHLRPQAVQGSPPHSPRLLGPLCHVSGKGLQGKGGARDAPAGLAQQAHSPGEGWAQRLAKATKRTRG